MKILWKDPDVERTLYKRFWVDDIKIYKSKVWYKGPKNKNKKWWNIVRNRVEYFDCYLRRGRGGPSEGVIPCSQSCYWSQPLRRWRHKERCTWSKEHPNWISQQQGLCIERNLTSWIFRWRYRRNKAATLIQNWYRGLFMFRLFKRAKASFHSYASYEPVRIDTVCDPNREPGDE